MVYFKKCRELDLLPLRHRLDFFAILLFHKIIHKTIAIELPTYIRLVPKTNLRSSHKDTLSYESLIKPRITQIQLNRKAKNKTTKNNTKPKPKFAIRKKKYPKTSKFFKKRINTNEKIYRNENFTPKTSKSNKNKYRYDNDIDVFNENKVFSGTYFYKTHMQWNNLPYELKCIENYEPFKTKLEEHMWNTIIVEDDSMSLDPYIDVPDD
jgi:hypothetical protein